MAKYGKFSYYKLIMIQVSRNFLNFFRDHPPSTIRPSIKRNMGKKERNSGRILKSIIKNLGKIKKQKEI